MAVQSLPSYTRANQRVIRRPVNPYDKSTVISILPRDIDEVKPTIDPGRFRLKAAKKDDFEILVVGPSSWYREVDSNQPLLEITNSSTEVAESLVRDYCNGILGCNMGDCMPGIFWVPGNFTKVSILKYVESKDNEFGTAVAGRTFDELMKTAKEKQKNWYSMLITMAETLWSNSNGHPRSINEDMKMAARELGLDPVWLATARDIQKIPCKACGVLINSYIAVCPNCKVIVNEEIAKTLKFANG